MSPHRSSRAPRGSQRATPLDGLTSGGYGIGPGLGRGSIPRAQAHRARSGYVAAGAWAGCGVRAAPRRAAFLREPRRPAFALGPGLALRRLCAVAFLRFVFRLDLLAPPRPPPVKYLVPRFRLFVLSFFAAQIQPSSNFSLAVAR